MQVTLRVRVDTRNGALAGGAYERRGYLAYWASWGTTQRDGLCVPLPAGEDDSVQIGPIPLPPLGELRGDEAVWLKQFALTDKSGIPQIDAKESGHVPRDQAAGTLDIPLRVLLQQKEIKDAPLCDAILRNALKQRETMAGASPDEAFERATRRSEKGRVHVQVTLTGPGHAQAYMRALQGPHKKLQYNSPAMIQAMSAAFDVIIAEHARHFFGQDNGTAALFPVNSREPSLDQLHLFGYQSDQGWLPAAYYPAAASCPREAYTKESLVFFEGQLAAALHRSGMSARTFLRAIREQHARGKADATVSDDYLRALAVILDSADFVANTANYTSDLRYPHAAPSGGTAPLGSGIFASKRKHKRTCQDLFALQLRAKLAAGGEDTDEDKRAMEVEDFGHGLATGTSNADDCEGDEVTASIALQCMEDACAACGSEATPLLRAATQVLAQRVMLEAAASVTSRYVDTEGNALTPHKELQDLPLIGDAMDERSEIGGHCHGVWVTVATAAHWFAQAGVDVAKELPELARLAASAGAWQRGRVGLTLISEGTGSTNPFVLPTGEVFGPEGARVGQHVRGTLGQIREQAPTLMDAFKCDGLTYYDVQQPAARRISTFYRGVRFVMSAKILRMNPVYGTCALVDMERRQSGVEIGQLLRAASTTSKAQLGLVSAYTGLGRARWEQAISPLAECILNQMPRCVYGRFLPAAAAPAALGVPVRTTFHEAMGRVNHALSDSVVGALSLTHEATLVQALDRHAHGLALRTAKLGAVQPAEAAEDGDVLAVALTSQPWRLNDPAVATKVRAELKALRASGLVLAHDYRRNRPLPQCMDALELRLVIPPPPAQRAAEAAILLV